MEEDWNLFERIRDQEQVLIFMNTALKSRVPFIGYGHRITIVFNMYSLWDLSGSSTQKAQRLFYELEDRLICRMKVKDFAIYAGRISSHNKMEMYFYAREDWDWEPELKRIMADFPSFRYYSAMTADPEWSFYLNEMAPSALEEQWMRNAKIAYALKRRGDNLELVREVQHWMYFSDSKRMNEVKSKVGQLGYRVIASEMDTERVVEPYVLQISKMHTLDVPTVNEITKELFELASEGGGTYDGWGTRLKLKLPAKIRARVKRIFLKFISTFR
ncbi:DUF695 domain-containing protein [Paenibacillus sp. GCM10023248]|uniref:DUF695 domain-containing protein n=1 Tax=Bacillales TaxID=1385 RepID=UPI002379E9B8|nr:MULTISPECIES: DUF695 domain-containing protein [Bacillales]MDD9265518.1 DUF695 domain-containing protein [Paenibacillus sp. MAHUQ-63]MDR6885428.1 regulator of RNase E activity RraB [Bacillus sp. 3255]